MKTLLEQSQAIRSAGARLAKSKWHVAGAINESTMVAEAKKWANKHGMEVMPDEKKTDLATGEPIITWLVVDKYGEMHGYLTGAKGQFEFDGQLPKANMSAGSRLAAPIKLPANTSFTVYQVKPDGSLSGKEHLNDADEVSEWYARKNYGQICVVNDKTGEKKYFQDSGQGLKEVRMSGRPFDGELQPQPNELPGGLGDGLTPADVDPIEFDIGMEMEKEHTPDEQVRKEIVLDHLAEDPAYYSKLKQMEGQGVDVQMFGEMRATKL